MDWKYAIMRDGDFFGFNGDHCPLEYDGD